MLSHFRLPESAAFDELHSRRRLGEAILYAFDLLELNGEDFRPLPFVKRKAKLARLLKRASLSAPLQI
jgi:ATP-dependent DNA ligase